MALAKVLHTLGSADEIMDIEDADIPVTLTRVHPRNFHVFCFGVIRRYRPRPEAIWRKERLNDEDAARTEMSAHRLDGSNEVGARSDICDRAEQTRNDVKAPSELEVDHVGTMEWDIGTTPASARKELVVNVKSFCLIPPSKMLDVATRPTADVEQGGCVRSALSEDMAENACLGGVVLNRIAEVVDIGGFGEQRQTSLARYAGKYIRSVLARASDRAA